MPEASGLFIAVWMADMMNGATLGVLKSQMILVAFIDWMFAFRKSVM